MNDEQSFKYKKRLTGRRYAELLRLSESALSTSLIITELNNDELASEFSHSL